MADLSNAFKYFRIDNSVRAQVAYPRVVDGVVEIVNVMLEPYMYDATTIAVKNLSELRLGDSDAMTRCRLTISELIGSSPRNVSFVMSERAQYSSSIFYDDFFTYNSSEDRYELTIYIPSKCINGSRVEGFNDASVLFEASSSSFEDDEDLTITGSYFTRLPPFILQGKAVRANISEEDPVFPNDTDRCSVGEGCIPAYYENSQGYSSDYLFTNSSPLYQILSSGFMPSEVSDQMEFLNVSGYMLDDDTGSSNYLATSFVGVSRDSATVMTISSSSTVVFTSDYDLSIWNTQIASDYANQSKATIKNVVIVSGEVRRINN